MAAGLDTLHPLGILLLTRRPPNRCPMSHRGSYALVLAVCLAAILISRKAIDADRGREDPGERVETAADPAPLDPVTDPALEGAPSPSAFASFKIDGMV